MYTRTFQGTNRFQPPIRPLERVNARGPPPKEFVGKVKRSLPLPGTGA